MTSNDKRFFLTWVLCGIVISILQHGAITYYLYWQWAWFDIIMHMLGGFFIGVGVLYGYVRVVVSHLQKMTADRIILYTVFFVLVVGLVWELFELATGMYDPILASTNGLLRDTIGDVVSDGIGALIAVGYYRDVYHIS